MTDVLTLPFPAAARESDPQTSHEAAAEVDVNARCGQVLAALQTVTPAAHGATCYELQIILAHTGIHMDTGWIASRLNQLQKAGLVEATDAKRPGYTNRKQTVWVIR